MSSGSSGVNTRRSHYATRILGMSLFHWTFPSDSEPHVLVRMSECVRFCIADTCWARVLRLWVSVLMRTHAFRRVLHNLYLNLFLIFLSRDIPPHDFPHRSTSMVSVSLHDIKPAECVRFRNILRSSDSVQCQIRVVGAGSLKLRLPEEVNKLNLQCAARTAKQPTHGNSKKRREDQREGREGKGEGKGREKGEGRREKGEGRREKGEGRREKREERREENIRERRETDGPEAAGAKGEERREKRRRREKEKKKRDKEEEEERRREREKERKRESEKVREREREREKARGREGEREKERERERKREKGERKREKEREKWKSVLRHTLSQRECVGNVIKCA